MNKELYQRRITAVRAKMQEKAVEAMFLSPSANLEYLTGERRRKPTYAQTMWPGQWISGAWLTLTQDPLFVVPRAVFDYEMENTEGWEVRILKDDEDPRIFLRDVARELGLAGQLVAVEDRAWGQFVIDLLAVEPTVRLTMASQVMAPVRAVKGPEELDFLRKACEITDNAFAEAVKKMRFGITEQDLVEELDHQIRQLGSEPSFTIGVFGWGSAFPRKALDRDHLFKAPIVQGTTVNFDFGALHEGYATDFGRVVHFGAPNEEYLAAYEAIIRAQEAAVSAMRSGNITAEQSYDLAFKVVEDAGFGGYSPDRLGHGIGMDIHEPPSLFTGDDTVLLEGMVCTVEPQIIKGPVLARIEDLVVVRSHGGEKLTHTGKELLVVS